MTSKTDAQSPIRVMLVDDSAVVRGMIARGIESDPDIRVVGAASDGQSALAMLRGKLADVAILDVEMPVMDGIETLSRILKEHPGVAVIMASSLTKRHAGLSLKALQMGAADYVPKPDGADALPEFFEELSAKIKAHGRKRKPSIAAPVTLPSAEASALAIGASTGGPAALLRIFAETRGAIRVPVFITQHMPVKFTALLAEQIAHASGAPAMEAKDSMRVEAGRVYIAPGGWHMLAERRGDDVLLRLSDAAPENFCKPAVDPMFRSLAGVYGKGLLAAVLTGMGADGAKGCISVADAKGRFVVQDEASSVVWGMPGAAFRTGRAEAALSLTDMSRFLALAMRGGR